MKLHSFSPKTDCTNECLIQKLSENNSFHDSYITHDGRNNFKVIFLFEQPNKSNPVLKLM